MSFHEYNTRTKKGDFQEALANLEQNITNSIQLKLNSKKKLIFKRCNN